MLKPGAVGAGSTPAMPVHACPIPHASYPTLHPGTMWYPTASHIKAAFYLFKMRNRGAGQNLLGIVFGGSIPTFL